MNSVMRSSQSCSRCRNHGKANYLKGHKKDCLYRNCNCEKCLVTKDRQRFIAKEIANHRREVKSSENSSSYQHSNPDTSNHVQIYNSMYEEISDDNSAEISSATQRTSEMRKEQSCARCRNHGILQLLKGHKKLACPFSECECAKCVVTSRRREVIGKQMKLIHDSKNIESSSSFESSLLTSEPDISPTPDFENLCIQQFVDADYEYIQQHEDDERYQIVPEENQYNQDVFFMIQSLFDKYACQGIEQKIQLIAAFSELANFNWQNIESALEKGGFQIPLH